MTKQDFSTGTGIPIEHLTGIIDTAIRNFLQENGKMLPIVPVPDAA